MALSAGSQEPTAADEAAAASPLKAAAQASPVGAPAQASPLKSADMGAGAPPITTHAPTSSVAGEVRVRGAKRAGLGGARAAKCTGSREAGGGYMPLYVRACVRALVCVCV